MEKRGLIGLVILAILATTIGSAATANATPSGNAAAKKKKCKKAHRAKKKCKKRKRKADPPQLPVIRATLTWFNGGSNDIDVDLFVFDAEGNQAGHGSDAIPLSSLSGDVRGEAGTETFTDSLFTPQAARDLSFGVCFFGPGADETAFTLTYVTADGIVHGDSRSPANSSHFDYPGGAPIPSGYCK
ncbi:MAG TPA: hypothetical protein VI035_00155 [Solirubrobacterales bacterium]